MRAEKGESEQEVVLSLVVRCWRCFWRQPPGVGAFGFKSDPGSQFQFVDDVIMR